MAAMVCQSRVRAAELSIFQINVSSWMYQVQTKRVFEIIRLLKYNIVYAKLLVNAAAPKQDKEIKMIQETCEWE